MLYCVCVCVGKDGAVSQADVQINGVQVEELTALRADLEELHTQHTLLQKQLAEKDSLIASLVRACMCVCGALLGQSDILLYCYFFVHCMCVCCVQKTEAAQSAEGPAPASENTELLKVQRKHNLASVHLAVFPPFCLHICPSFCRRLFVCLSLSLCAPFVLLSVCSWSHRRWSLCEHRFRVSRPKSHSCRVKDKNCSGEPKLW